MSLFGGSGNVTGYNCGQVNALRDTINNVAIKAGENIVERLHSDIIVPMSSVWYAPEAVEFFTGFAATVKASGEGITNAFDAFRGAVESAGKNWAENTQGEAPSLPAIDMVNLELNVSDILSDNAGNVTIDENQATTIADKLPEVEAAIKSDLEGLAATLNAETAFMGHGQAEAVQSCFVQVSGEIHKIFKYLTEGEESLQGQIKKAAAKYSEVSSGISSAFSNTSSN